ncbi:hypothetical protein GS942_21395 [Rhodococcus hoagii]|nr:hypothetical protein [Prescottella equi]
MTATGWFGKSVTVISRPSVVHHLADLMPLIASELETELHIVLLDQQEDGTLVRGI